MGFAEARKQAGKTQEETAKHLGITTGAVSQWETGTTKPSIARLASLAAYYGCTIEELLTDKEGA